MTKSEFRVANGAADRSADFQSAVSPICNRPSIGHSKTPDFADDPQVTNLRYSRLQVCATSVGNTVNRYECQGERTVDPRCANRFRTSPEVRWSLEGWCGFEAFILSYLRHCLRSYKYTGTYQISPALKPAAPENGRTPLNAYKPGGS